MTLSPHQRKITEGMRQGIALHMLFMHIRTVAKLEKLKIIEKVEGKYQLTELGEKIEL